MRSLTLAYSCPDEWCEAEIDVTYTAPTAPTIRLDPLDSDPGDPGEVECPDHCPHCGGRLDDDAVWNWCQREVARRY